MTGQPDGSLTSAGGSGRPLLVHVTTTDISLELLLGPQLEAFRDAGYEVLGASAPGPYVASLAARGIDHIPLEHATRAMAVVEDVKAMAELYSLFRRLRPDVVHTHNPKPGLYGRIAARVARIPVVVNTVHGLYALPEDPIRKRAVVYGLERVAAACSDAELVQNPEDIPVLRRLGVGGDKLHLLGNGIDLARFDPGSVPAADVRSARAELGGADSGSVVVGVVGRLVREKGYREVFEAARLLRDERPSVRIAVVGPSEGDKLDALTREETEAASRLGVEFLGERHDVVRLYAAMDVYVLASYREGYPRSAMEASAMGLPVIATNIRGCRQVVEDGVTGILVPVHDAVSLAAAIKRLADDEVERREMGSAARRRALEEFDQTRCIDITLATYERLLARKAGAQSAGSI